jgi:hypothetical protein
MFWLLEIVNSCAQARDRLILAETFVSRHVAVAM